MALDSVLADMGYKSLRPGQEEPITRLMMGNDVIAILPTGGGKTAIYAAVTKALNYKTIVFSPLVALMADQVQSLNKKGVRAAAVNSAQSEVLNTTALQDWSNDLLDVLIVAPERMESPQFLAAVDMCCPEMVTVDECHTVSQWAATFRVSYTKVGNFIDKYEPRIVLALTATATKKILEDVKRILHIENCVVCRHLPARTNIELHSTFVEDADLRSAVLNKVRSIKGPIIVYCPTVKQVTEMTKFLASMGEEVTFYHGQMTSTTDKAINQEEFMSGRKRVMVATNAFGMGIDKADIRGIIHVSPPGSIEAVSQEVGRAARDGKPSQCWMFNTPTGMNVQKWLFISSNPSSRELMSVYNYLNRHKDSGGEVRLTTEEIKGELGIESVQGALNLLVNYGCITRYTPEHDIRTFFVNPEKRDEVKKGVREAIVDGLYSLGVNKGKTAMNWDSLEIDMAALVRHTGKMAATVSSHLRQMQKDNVLQAAPVFRGKVTRVEREPTAEELEMTDVRYEVEKQKMDDVVTYLQTPDSEKHKFLSKYFEIDL